MCIFTFVSVGVGNEEQVHNSSCLPNELLLSLFHNSLEHELSDREIPLADGDHLAFMHQILKREREGHVAPFSLPVIKGQYLSLSHHLNVQKVTYISDSHSSDKMYFLLSYSSLFLPQCGVFCQRSMLSPQTDRTL